MADHVLTNQFARHSAFATKLPPEILSLIFFYLSQRDCIRSMAVCKSWYTMIPNCSRRAWKKLVLHPAYIRRGDHVRWEQCLGRHVKSITFSQFQDEGELYRMMQKLADCNCLHAEHIGK